MRKFMGKIGALLLAVMMMATVVQPALAAGKDDKTVNKTSVVLSCAASTANAMNDIKKAYESKHPNINLVMNYGSSGTLEKQITYGGRADIFISADNDNMYRLAVGGSVEHGTQFNLLKNDLVLIVPKNSTLKINSFKDLLSNKIKKVALGEPTSVPAGKYAMQALAYYKDDYTVKQKAVYAKDVTQVLQYVASGNVPVGIVYYTDAISSDKVEIVATADDKSHEPIIYPAAVMQRGEHKSAARDFLAYLKTDDAKSVFKQYGFGTY